MHLEQSYVENELHLKINTPRILCNNCLHLLKSYETDSIYATLTRLNTELDPWCLTECVMAVCVCLPHPPPMVWNSVGSLSSRRLNLFADILHRRRPGPKGDWTSHHPRGDCGPTKGELCWSRAHRHPSPAPRPSDPDREHRSVKKRGTFKILLTQLVHVSDLNV